MIYLTAFIAILLFAGLAKLTIDAIESYDTEDGDNPEP